MSKMSRTPGDEIIGPETVVDGGVVLFDGTSGKVAKDGGAHLADTIDPHGASMTVSTSLITPKIVGSAGTLTFDVFNASDQDVQVTNSGAGVADLAIDGVIKPITDQDITAEFNSASDRKVLVRNLGSGVGILDAEKLMAVDLFTTGIVNLASLPTTDPSVVGQLWRSGGDLRVSI